jgi:ABC-2 type transport system permease protein
MTFVIPVGFVSYYPSTAFLDHTGEAPVTPAFAYLTPLVGLGLFAAAYAFWKVGLNHYQSTGS